MEEFNAQQVMSGTEGEVWIDGKKLPKLLHLNPK